MAIAYVGTTFTEGTVAAAGADANVTVNLPSCGIGDILVVYVQPVTDWTNSSFINSGVSPPYWRVCDGTESSTTTFSSLGSGSNAAFVGLPFMATVVQYTGAGEFTTVVDAGLTATITNNRTGNILTDWSVEFTTAAYDAATIGLVYFAESDALQALTSPSAPTGIDASTSNITVRADRVSTGHYSATYPSFPSSSNQLFRYIASGDALEVSAAPDAILSGPGGNVFYGFSQGIQSYGAVVIYDVTPEPPPPPPEPSCPLVTYERHVHALHDGTILQCYLPPRRAGDLMVIVATANDSGTLEMGDSSWTEAFSDTYGGGVLSPPTYNGVLEAPPQDYEFARVMVWYLIADSDSATTDDGPIIGISDPRAGGASTYLFRQIDFSDESGETFVPFLDPPITVGSLASSPGSVVAEQQGSPVDTVSVDPPALDVGYVGNHKWITLGFVHGDTNFTYFANQERPTGTTRIDPAIVGGEQPPGDRHGAGDPFLSFNTFDFEGAWWKAFQSPDIVPGSDTPAQSFNPGSFAYGIAQQDVNISPDDFDYRSVLFPIAALTFAVLTPAVGSEGCTVTTVGYWGVNVTPSATTMPLPV